MNPMARRMFELVEPIGVIPYAAEEPNEAMFALGFSNYWDTYFAGRAAPLGRPTAEVVDALFYNFAPGEVARASAGVSTRSPRIRRSAATQPCLRAAMAASGVVVRHTFGMCRATSPGAKL